MDINNIWENFILEEFPEGNFGELFAEGPESLNELESLNENKLQIEVRDMNDDASIDNKQITANRHFTKIESEAHKSKIEIYLKRYDSFIKSPRVHFVYDTAFYTAFLLIFSYVMLCDLSYYDTENEKTFLGNSTFDENTNVTFIRIQNETYFEKNIVKNPSSLEYLLIFWVFSFICEEFSQVNVYLSICFKLQNDLKNYFIFKAIFKQRNS